MAAYFVGIIDPGFRIMPEPDTNPSENIDPNILKKRIGPKFPDPDLKLPALANFFARTNFYTQNKLSSIDNVLLSLAMEHKYYIIIYREREKERKKGLYGWRVSKNDQVMRE